eukprot:568280-Amphidinium_carterae.4
MPDKIHALPKRQTDARAEPKTPQEKLRRAEGQDASFRTGSNQAHSSRQHHYNRQQHHNYNQLQVQATLPAKMRHSRQSHRVLEISTTLQQDAWSSICADARNRLMHASHGNHRNDRTRPLTMGCVNACSWWTKREWIMSNFKPISPTTTSCSSPLVDVMVLQETHVNAQSVEAAQRQLRGARLRGVWSSGVSGHAGVAVIARASLRLRKIWESDLHVGRSMCVQLYTGHSTLYMFVVYGYVHDIPQTEAMLSELHAYMRENIPSGMPVCVQGDFNASIEDLSFLTLLDSAGWRRVHAASIGTCFVTGAEATSIDAILVNGAATKLLGRSWIDQDNMHVRPHRPLWVELRKSEHKIPHLLPPMKLLETPPESLTSHSLCFAPHGSIDDWWHTWAHAAVSFLSGVQQPCDARITGPKVEWKPAARMDIGSGSDVSLELGLQQLQGITQGLHCLTAGNG